MTKIWSQINGDGSFGRVIERTCDSKAFLSYTEKEYESLL